MVKPVWVAVAFAAGIAVGVVVTRGVAPKSATSIEAVNNPPVDSAPATPPTVSPGPAIDARAMPAASAGVTPVARYEPPPVPIESTAPVTEEVAEYNGYSEPIEVGPVFRKALAAKGVPGVTDPLGDAHRALEREMRDDSWSYPLEAEIQNSLVADAGAGNFTVEHVECRATACEIRLSGKGQQGEAIAHWSDNIHTQPWSQRLLLNMSSSISNNDRVDRILILRKPPKPPKPD